MIKKLNTNVVENYILAFLLIAFSGFPFFSANDYYLLIGLFYALYIFHKRKLTISPFYIYVLAILSIIVIGQTIVFEYINIRTTIGLYVRWTFPYLVVIITGIKLIRLYVKTIYVFVIISFLFFVPSIIIPGFENFLMYNIAPIFHQNLNSTIYSYNPNILIYTIKTSGGMFDVFRNSGPFWEPGAFAGFTILALIFNLIINRTFVNKENVLFIVGILSTFSVAGYLALFMLMFFYFSLVQRRKFGFAFIPFIIYLAFNLYQGYPILNQKIDRSINDLSESNIYSSRRSRVISARVDLLDIREYPIFGKGRNVSTRFGVEEISYLEHRNNGLTTLAVKYGLPFFLLYFLMYFRTYKILCKLYNNKKSYPYFILIVIGVIGFGENYFQSSFFIALFYLHLPLYKKFLKEKKKRNENRYSNTYAQSKKVIVESP